MADPPDDVDFMEVAPENWINVGGKLGEKFRFFTELYPLLIHGLSLSIGSPAPLNESLLHDVKAFMDEHDIRFYSEHLSYCGDDGQLYDLMPIPFTEEAIKHVVERILRTQDIIGRKIAIENVSYYAAPGKEMEEIEFLNAILEQADCDLLLDVNNIYVSAMNHGFDSHIYIDAIPQDRVWQIHLAGHRDFGTHLLDTHSRHVCDEVWQLYRRATRRFGAVASLVEWDEDVPEWEILEAECGRARAEREDCLNDASEEA